MLSNFFSSSSRDFCASVRSTRVAVRRDSRSWVGVLPVAEGSGVAGFFSDPEIVGD